MTSSLVGSEMCIRDSGKAWKASQKKHATGRTAAQPLPTCATSFPQQRSCLLYTSDAADDM
eukprot:5566955-Prorocentrum_lima.AAC.1